MDESLTTPAVDELLFTPAALLDILSQIDELSDKDITLTESADGSIYLSIGDSTYNIEETTFVEVEVNESTMNLVEDLNDATYDSIADEEHSVDLSNAAISCGVASEVAKTILVGGLVRLTAKLLKK